MLAGFSSPLSRVTAYLPARGTLARFTLAVGLYALMGMVYFNPATPTGRLWLDSSFNCVQHKRYCENGSLSYERIGKSMDPRATLLPTMLAHLVLCCLINVYVSSRAYGPRRLAVMAAELALMAMLLSLSHVVFAGRSLTAYGLEAGWDVLQVLLITFCMGFRRQPAWQPGSAPPTTNGFHTKIH